MSSDELDRLIAQEAQALSLLTGYAPGSANAVAFSTKIENAMYRVVEASRPSALQGTGGELDAEQKAKLADEIAGEIATAATLMGISLNTRQYGFLENAKQFAFVALKIIGREAQTPPPERELDAIGWLIESKDYHLAHFLAIGKFETLRWTPNHEDAVRFSRKQDAEAVGRFIFPNGWFEITEHVWLLKPACKPTDLR